MIIVMLAVFGLIFGSFVNAMVWRLRQQSLLAGDEELDMVKTKTAKLPRRAAAKPSAVPSAGELSMLTGRSMCSQCYHPLAAKDLVPLFSWLALRGKCRYCRAKIQDNPLVEVVTPLLFVLSYLCWPLTLQGTGLVRLVFWLLFVVGFMVLAVYDLRWFLLPNRVVFPLIWLALIDVATVAMLKHDPWFAIDALLGAGLLSGIFWLLFTVSDGAWIGGGDVKLAVVLGLLAGSAVQSMLVLFFASVVGTLLSVPLLVRGKSGLKMKVPFGPYLLLGTVIAVLFGQRIIDWYTGLFVA